MAKALAEAETDDPTVAVEANSARTETSEEVAPVSVPIDPSQGEAIDNHTAEPSDDAAATESNVPSEAPGAAINIEKDTIKEPEQSTTTTAAAALENNAKAEEKDAKVNQDASKEPASPNATTKPISESPSKATPRLSLQERINTYSTESLREGTLPSIEECLFGIPRDVTKGVTPEEEEMAHFVPLSLIRRVSSQGIDDDDEQSGGSFRALTWRVLLGFLPADRRKWTEVATRERESYYSFLQELFCVEDRDLSGEELRGHHSKRHSSKQRKQHDNDGMTKKERRESKKERRASRRKSKEGEVPSTTSRAPVKFMDDSLGSSSSHNDSSEKLAELTTKENGCDDTPSLTDETASSAPIHEDKDSNNNPRPSNNDSNHTKAKLRLSSSDLLHDDPSQWNMSVREQKILERLTNHEAVNQLLVKRDCKVSGRTKVCLENCQDKSFYAQLPSYVGRFLFLFVCARNGIIF